MIEDSFDKNIQEGGVLSVDQIVGHHEISNLMPRMSEAEQVALLLDVKLHKGILKPVVLFEGLILDGRERRDACLKLEFETPYKVFIGSEEEAKSYNLSVNLIRSHYNQSQKAMVGANLFVERNESVMGYDTEHGSINLTATSLGVNPVSMYKAARVSQFGTPELKKQVVDGEISVVNAEKKLGESPSED